MAKSAAARKPRKEPRQGVVGNIQPTAPAAVQPEPKKLLKLDFGCGPHKREGFTGVDRTAFVGVDQVVDLVERLPGVSAADVLGGANSNGRNLFKPWPWANESVEEAHASHFLEHLQAKERVWFANELWRILTPGGKCMIITPHWCSNRAYGDLTHAWPPVSEMWMFYLNQPWRSANAPHNDFYECNFDATNGSSYGPDLLVRNEEYRQFALRYYKEVALDLIFNFTKLPMMAAPATPPAPPPA